MSRQTSSPIQGRTAPALVTSTMRQGKYIAIPREEDSITETASAYGVVIQLYEFQTNYRAKNKTQASDHGRGMRQGVNQPQSDRG